MLFKTAWNLDNLNLDPQKKKGVNAFSNALKFGYRILDELENAIINSEKDAIIPLYTQLLQVKVSLNSFVDCCCAQDIFNEEYQNNNAKFIEFNALFKNLLLKLSNYLATVSEKDSKELIEANQDIKFFIKENKQLCCSKLSLEQEMLVNNLASSGLHSWYSLWSEKMGELNFSFQGNSYSFAQIENKLNGHLRNQRKECFNSIKTQLGSSQNIFAHILNNISGFRLALTHQRGWGHLHESHVENRMTGKTLQTLLQSIDSFKPNIKKYLNCKSALLGVKKLDWFDLEAPIFEDEEVVEYQNACSLIISLFHSFSPKMAAFAEKALKNNWVDAEERHNKAPGGFCTGFPFSKESRIFFTYSKTFTNLITLAHELGHAFHNNVIFDLPPLHQDIRMSTAEIASTMAENIVLDGLLKKTLSSIETLRLLEIKLSRSISYLSNIYARFLFEDRLYALRKKGFVDSNTLCQIMLDSQKTAYSESLGEYHPLFWAGKMHFFLTENSFYNYPYAFGFLLSQSLYEKLNTKDDPESAFINFLEDTGRMSVEDLIQTHMTMNLSEKEIWEKGLNSIKEMIHKYTALASEIMM